MPSAISMNTFRLRWRPKPPPNSEDDSDISSSPEEATTRTKFHISAPKNGRKNVALLVNSSHDEKPSRGAPEKVSVSAKAGHQNPAPVQASSSAEQTSKLLRKPTRHGLVNMTTNAPPQPSTAAKHLPQKPTTLLRRVTSKLHISIPTNHSRPSHLDIDSPRVSLGRPRSPNMPRSPTLPNALVSRENREAALRERGLLPPRKDLSEQEREADEKLDIVASAVIGGNDDDMLSAATKIKEEWLALNRRPSADSSVDSHAGVYPRVLSAPNFGTMSMPTLISHRSSDAESIDHDPPFPGRPSFSSSAALPVSNSSQLATLQEEPTPPLDSEPIGQERCLKRDLPPPIIITPVEDTFSPSMLVESPVSGTFPSVSLPPPPPEKEKENLHSKFPPPPGPRRRTTDSDDRRRRTFAPGLSKFNTSSLSNLRRSVIGSIRAPSTLPPSPTLPSHLGNGMAHADSCGATLRPALSPTMHSRGSILLETKEIMDEESRRLSEMAFLD
ncbi:hypothetical protein BJ138DRAFT_1145870 [Hygrophoropsis aurantiaca]|uniref:Uncharacterized protein n=1 Tax=Hygrophoropsis aurantiaca TaxID=72124 RepID=A0ACB8AJQ6_9AGAM|nr:hypothetical protein BJ138DRAFT_1145870 [Hygrophoropsis aurantiaca]